MPVIPPPGLFHRAPQTPGIDNAAIYQHVSLDRVCPRPASLRIRPGVFTDFDMSSLTTWPTSICFSDNASESPSTLLNTPGKRKSGISSLASSPPRANKTESDTFSTSPSARPSATPPSAESSPIASTVTFPEPEPKSPPSHPRSRRGRPKGSRNKHHSRGRYASDKAFKPSKTGKTPSGRNPHACCACQKAKRV
ncbi:hypothetical protein B9479_002570 [Cryptococcus floricola]|uniref:Uncharacterized protein n=1 Tax=Cryptococcus floricola TaxID=2591691 RepID=A0A5D3B301_9TREE|nr:hypothetical protein B9479_002570 [Cryptococcus floricola]